MKAWRFKLKRSPIEISEKLDSELRSIGGFVFNMNHENNTSVTFKIRKRFLYVWYLAFQNWTVVKGELLNKGPENETNVKITFNQHFFIRVIVFTHIILVFGFLLAIISGINVSTSLVILVVTLLILGIVLWLAIQRKFEKDVQKYKTLMTDILDIQ
jgi:small-conductance mechanosensitive channel